MGQERKERVPMVSFSRILVPLDGSPLSEAALPFARTIAEKFGSELLLLYALDVPTPTPPASDVESTIGWVREARRDLLERAQRYLERTEQALGDAGIRVRTLFRDGPAAETILEVAAAERADLIVISTHGHGGRPGGLVPWTFGSVAERVSQHSACPVLIVRPGRRSGVDDTPRQGAVAAGTRS
jgi:nucleotide-binding universal stress UspA family protein